MGGDGPAADQLVGRPRNGFDDQMVCVARDRIEPEQHAGAAGLELRLHEHGHGLRRCPFVPRLVGRSEHGPDRAQEAIGVGDPEQRCELTGHRRCRRIFHGGRRPHDARSRPVFPECRQGVEQGWDEVLSEPAGRGGGGGEDESREDRKTVGGRSGEVRGFRAGQRGVECGLLLQPHDRTPLLVGHASLLIKSFRPSGSSPPGDNVTFVDGIRLYRSRERRSTVGVEEVS